MLIVLQTEGSTMDKLEWLHKHMRDHLSNSARIEPDDTVLNFPNVPSATTSRDGGTALDLVYQAAEMIRSIENRANEFESRARGLAEEATEKLKRAERHIQDLEVQQRAAETCIQQAHLKLQEAGEALKRERARVQTAENRLPQLEMRARSAEARAQECENALARIEDAIRTQILRQGASAAVKSTAVA
jgi:chromosome segregation ATPase